MVEYALVLTMYPSNLVVAFFFSTLVLLTNGQANTTEAGGRVSLECDGAKIKATVNTTKLFHGFGDNRKVALTLDNCDDSKYTVINNTVKTDFHDCSYNITQTNDFIIQEVMLTVQTYANTTASVIIRGGETMVFLLRCTLHRRLNVSLAEGIEVVEGKEEFTKKANANITAMLTFYRSDLFIVKAPLPLQVTDYEPIYMQITALPVQQLFKFIVEDCYATPTSNPLDRTKYLYFEDKCLLDETMKTYPLHSGPNKFSHSIQAFRFIRLKNQVFFHCRLLICKNNTATKECMQDCATSGRKRRAIENGVRERFYVNSGAVMYREKPDCNKKTCPLHSRCHDLHPAVCRCNDGYVLSWDSNVCIKKNVFTMKNLHFDQKFIPSYSIPTSRQFITLAKFIEQHLMTSYSLQRDVIRGVKVICARGGSVVVDIQILYSPKVTPQEAFHSFIGSVFQAEANMKLLRIKTYITPFLESCHYDKEEISSTLITALSIVGPLFALLLAMSVFLLWWRTKDRKVEEKVQATYYDNKSIDMEKVAKN